MLKIWDLKDSKTDPVTTQQQKAEEMLAKIKENDAKLTDAAKQAEIDRQTNRQADRQTSAEFRMADKIMQTRAFHTVQQCPLSDQSPSHFHTHSFVVPFLSV